MSIEGAWGRVCDWLTGNLPEALEGLREPAGEGAIGKCEKALGVAFPPALRDFYRLHDGEDEDRESFVFDGLWILPLEEIAVAHETMLSLDEDRTFADWRADIDDNMIAISGPVKALTHSPRWIQFAESPTWSGADVRRCIDFDPAPGGTAGQVIEIDSAEDHYRVLANSFEEYLELYADGLEAGRYVVDGECIRDTLEPDPDSWGIPEYLEGADFDDGSSFVPRSSPTVDEISADEPVTLTGEVSMLFGPVAGGTELEFTLTHTDGRKYLVFASASLTDGYETVFEGGAITLEATRFPESDSDRENESGANTPDLIARSIVATGG